MSILTPTITVIIIWALFVILTITIALRFYALRIHSRRKEQFLSRHPNRTLLSPPPNGTITCKVVLTATINALHILTLLYCVAVTLAVIWGYDLADERRALVIQYGGAENDVGNVLLGDGEVGKFRRYLRTLGLAMELAYVVIIWILKGGLIAVGWQVGKGLGLWGSRSMAEAETVNFNASEGNGASAGREKPMDAETKSMISLAKAVLYTLGGGTIITFLGVIIYKCIVIGMSLSRNEVQDITSHGLREEVVEAQKATIVAAVGSLGTYLLSIVLAIILLSISQSTHQPHQPDLHPRSPVLLYGGIFTLFLIVFTTAASSARTGFILMNTNSIQPRIGDLITGGILFGRVTDSTYGEALGLNEKVFAVLEMMLGGTALCIPGMRVLFDSARDIQTRQSLRSSTLLSISELPSPASVRESASRPLETRSETAPVLQQQGDVLQSRSSSYNSDPYTAIAARIASFAQGPEVETIGTRAITRRDRSRSRSRSRSRNRSRKGSHSTGRNHGHVAPGAQLQQQGNNQQRQIEEQVQWLPEQQGRQNQHQQGRHRVRTEAMEGYSQRSRENVRRDRAEWDRHNTVQGSSRGPVALIPPLSISKQPQQFQGSSEKSLPPLPLASE